MYKAFQRFAQVEKMVLKCTWCLTDLDKLNLVEFADGGLILGLSQYTLLPNSLKNDVYYERKS